MKNRRKQTNKSKVPKKKKILPTATKKKKKTQSIGKKRLKRLKEKLVNLLKSLNRQRKA